jgi:iron(III) transport system substrate-binding protein
MTLRTLIACLVVAACKPAEPEKPDVQVSTNLDPATVDTALQVIAKNGGPRAERTQADAGVRWESDPYAAIAAATRAELQPAPASAQDVPPLWRDPGGTWVAVGGRAEVLLTAQDQLGGQPAPQRYTSLVEPWLKGKVALVAPVEGMALAHFAALYAAWGEERMNLFLDQLAKNQPQIYATDAEVRAAVMSGRATVGLLSSDEAAKAVASAAKVVANYPNQKSIGTFVWPTALSLTRSSNNEAQDRQLLERLGDRSVEALLVARVPGYLPLRPQIPVPPGVRSAANLVVVSVDPARILEQIAQRKGGLVRWAKETAAAGGTH